MLTHHSRKAYMHRRLQLRLETPESKPDVEGQLRNHLSCEVAVRTRSSMFGPIFRQSVPKAKPLDRSENRSALGLYALHHRSLSVQNLRFFSLNPPGSLRRGGCGAVQKSGKDFNKPRILSNPQ